MEKMADADAGSKQTKITRYHVQGNGDDHVLDNLHAISFNFIILKI